MITFDRTIGALLMTAIGTMIAGMVIIPVVSGGLAAAVQVWRDAAAEAKTKCKEICDGSGLF